MRNCCETHGTNFCPECGENLTGIHTLATLLMQCKSRARTIRTRVENFTGDPDNSLKFINAKKDLEKWETWCDLLLPVLSSEPVDRWLAFKRDLSVRATKSLARLNINSFDTLCRYTATDLQDAKWCGITTVAEITSTLHEFNLTLKREESE